MLVYASPASGLTRAGKYKFGARVGKYKLGARTVKYKLGARADKHKLGVRAGKYKLGARARARGQAEGWGLGNTNTQIVKSTQIDTPHQKNKKFNGYSGSLFR